MSKNEKVTENKEQKEQTEQKVMTKYDRKVQKRKEEKEKEKKEERISTAIGIVVLVALVCLVASFPIRTYLATHETYMVVNGEAVNKVLPIQPDQEQLYHPVRQLSDILRTGYQQGSVHPDVFRYSDLAGLF